MAKNAPTYEDLLTAMLQAMIDEAPKAAWRKEIEGLSREQREQIEYWIKYHTGRAAERIAIMFRVMLEDKERGDFDE